MYNSEEKFCQKSKFSHYIFKLLNYHLWVNFSESEFLYSSCNRGNVFFSQQQKDGNIAINNNNGSNKQYNKKEIETYSAEFKLNFSYLESVPIKKPHEMSHL